MSNIQQLYCTHCTFGSSALESREGAMLDKPLGYSVRAGSGNKDELRRYFRDVERFLYYYLPSDAPAEQKVQLVAETAPKRLVFCSNINGQQMLGQLSYRQFDTAGRPGSYFGHVLLSRLTRDNDQNRWSPLDALRSWNGKWTQEDNPSQAKTLSTIESLAEVLPDGGPVLNDDLLLNFLTTPAGQPFNDPAGIIPARWIDVPPAQRAELLATTLQAYVALGSNRRESVLLVVEHPLAALLFYGVARLLPPGPVCHDFGFSTFETNPDRLPVPLAALEFYDPKVTDLRPEVYRGRGYVRNTWLGRCSEDKRFNGRYGKLLVDTLLNKGWLAVDGLLADFARTNPTNTTQLEPLATAAEMAEALLTPTVRDVQIDGHNKTTLAFLSGRVCTLLTAAPPDTAQIDAIAKSPKLVPLLNLVAGSNTSQPLVPIVEQLVSTVPHDALPALIDSNQIDSRFKVTAVIQDMSQHGWRLPENCPSLLQMPSAPLARLPSQSQAETRSLLSEVLVQLSVDQAEALQDQLPRAGHEAFVHALLDAMKQVSNTANKNADFWPLLTKTVSQLDEPAFVALLKNHAQILKATRSAEISARVEYLLANLSSSPKDFVTRLSALKSATILCPDVAQAELTHATWEQFSNMVKKLRPVGKPLDKYRQAEIFRDLALHLYKLEPYDPQVGAPQRVRTIQSLCDAILGSPIEIPPEVQRALHKVFHTGSALDYQPYGSRAKNHLAGLEKRTLIHFGIAAAVVVSLVIAFDLFLRPSTERRLEETGSVTPLQTSNTSAQNPIEQSMKTKPSEPKANQTAGAKGRTPENPKSTSVPTISADNGLAKIKSLLVTETSQTNIQSIFQKVKDQLNATSDYHRDYFSPDAKGNVKARDYLKQHSEKCDKVLVEFLDLKGRMISDSEQRRKKFITSDLINDRNVMAALDLKHSPGTAPVDDLQKRLDAILSSEHATAQSTPYLQASNEVTAILDKLRAIFQDMKTREEPPPLPTPALPFDSDATFLRATDFADLRDPKSDDLKNTLLTWKVSPGTVEFKLHGALYVSQSSKGDGSSKGDTRMDLWKSILRVDRPSNSVDDAVLRNFYNKWLDARQTQSPETISSRKGDLAGNAFPLERKELDIQVIQSGAAVPLATIKFDRNDLLFEWHQDAEKNSTLELRNVLKDCVLEVITREAEGVRSRYIGLSPQKVITYEEPHNSHLEKVKFTSLHRQVIDKALHIEISYGSVRALARKDDNVDKKDVRTYPLVARNDPEKGRAIEVPSLAKEYGVEQVIVDDRNLRNVINSIDVEPEVQFTVRCESPNELGLAKLQYNAAISDHNIKKGDFTKAHSAMMKDPTVLTKATLDTAKRARDDAQNAEKAAKSKVDEIEGKLGKIAKAKESVRGLNLALFYVAGERDNPIRVECIIVKNKIDKIVSTQK